MIVANLDPTVTLSGPTSSDEGQTQSYTFSITDAGADTFSVDASDCGANGVQTAYAFDGVDGSFDCTWDDNFLAEDVSVAVSDDDGGTDSDAISVDIDNLDPTVTLSGPTSSDEGQTQSYTFSITDAGADTFSVDASDCGANGVQTAYAFDGVDGSFDCTWDDNFLAEDVSVAVSDDDGGTDSDAISVDIDNLDPTVTLSGPTSSDEGQTQSYTFSITDAGADTFSVDASDCGANGVQTAYAFDGVDGSFDCTWDDNFLAEDVSVAVSDDDGGTDSDAISVDIDNLDPTVTLTGATPVNEGDTVTYSYTLTDAGSADSFVLVLEDCDGGTLSSNADFNPADGSGSFECTFADGPASHDVSVTVNDDDGGSGSDTLSVSVLNVKPTISLSGPATADEGDTETYSFLVSDPGLDTHTITVNCGANGAQVGPTAYNPLDGNGSFDCFFADGPTTTNVTATVTDSDGAADTDAQLVTVTVANVAPTVTLTGAATADEGDTVSFSYTTSDPGSEVFSLDEETCDGGTLSNGSFNSVDGSGSFDCTFADNATYNVSVTVSDGDQTGSDTISVIVANLDPTVTLSGPTSSDEGQTQSYTFSITDAGADTFSVDASDCGANGVQTAYAFDGVDGSFDCTWDDNFLAEDVSVAVSDDDGGTGSDAISVDIDNLDPTVILSGPTSSDEGQTQSYTFSITDAGADIFSVDASDCGANGVQTAYAFDGVDGSFDCTWDSTRARPRATPSASPTPAPTPSASTPPTAVPTACRPPTPSTASTAASTAPGTTTSWPRTSASRSAMTMAAPAAMPSASTSTTSIRP